MNPYEGGCACGAVRYVSHAPSQFSFHCQCRQCQRASGTGHSSQFVVPADAVTVSGELKFHDQTADDGNTVSRGFCPVCGSPIMGKSTGHPGIVIIHAASLDDPGHFEPQKVVWSSMRQEWDFIDPSLPRE